MRVSARSLAVGWLEGSVEGGQYQWTFCWHFRAGGRLDIYPSLGRALIKEPLQRFLEKHDFQLETGETYAFTVRARI
ncbi:DUF3146 family protein [Gloeobacter kilaueensis]